MSLANEIIALIKRRGATEFAAWHSATAAEIGGILATARHEEMAQIKSKAMLAVFGRHTPLPWRLKAGEVGTCQRSKVLGPPHPVDGGDYAALAEMSEPHDAALVVWAVNSYADWLT